MTGCVDLTPTAAPLLRIGESITVAIAKGTVPFSSDENWDSPPVISSPLLSREYGIMDSRNTRVAVNMGDWLRTDK